MKTKNIIIITYNWPPRNTIGTFRPYSWAIEWAKKNTQVTVITSEKQNFDAPLDLKLKIPQNIEVLEIPLKKKNYFNKILKFNKLKIIARNIKRNFNKLGIYNIDLRQAWVKNSEPYLENISKKADIIISTSGPPSVHYIANKLKILNPNIFWVADYRDLWSQNHAVDLPDNIRKSQGKEEINIIKNSNLLTTISKELSLNLKSLHNKECLVYPNGFDIDIKSIEERICNYKSYIGNKETINIVHTGAIYKELRDPQPLFNCICNLIEKNKIKSSQIKIQFYGSYLEHLKPYLQNLKYKDIVELKGYVPREKIIKIQKNADILLLIESPKIEARGVLPGKIFEYFAACKPILCIGSKPEFAIGELLKKTGTGIVIGPDQHKNLNKIIYGSISGKGIYDLYKPNIKEISFYSRKFIAERMLNKIIELST